MRANTATRVRSWLLFGKLSALTKPLMGSQHLVYGLLGGLAIALTVAAATDIRRRQIDNWLNLAIAMGAPAFWWASELPLWAKDFSQPSVAMQLGVALAAFAVLCGMFAMRVMGGGDVKLLTALALWLPWPPFMQLLLYMSLIGGVLTVVLGAWHVMRRQRDKLKIPYGVAIASAGLLVMALNYGPHGAALAGNYLPQAGNAHGLIG